MSDQHNHQTPHGDERKRWLDEKKNVDKIWFGLIGVCALLFLADFFIEKHPYFGIEEFVNFYGFYGFVACFMLVVAAAQLRKALMRDEDYYQRFDAVCESSAESRADIGDKDEA